MASAVATDELLREVNEDITRQQELEMASYDALLETFRTVRALEHESLLREKETLERILGYACHVLATQQKRND